MVYMCLPLFMFSSCSCICACLAADPDYRIGHAYREAKRNVSIAKAKSRASLRPSERPLIPPGLPLHRWSRTQKLSLYQQRKEGEPAPIGRFPVGYNLDPQTGHRQTTKYLFGAKLKPETKEYF